MLKIQFSLIFAFLMLSGLFKMPSGSETQDNRKVLKRTKALAQDWPSDLKVTPFAGPELTPSPACLAVAPTGEVYVGVDMMGSLGKEPEKGSIIKLVDSNNDGQVDQHTEFAKVDNPRGIISLGDQVFVLHTTFSKETGIASGMDLVVFEDANQDGVADGPSKPLIQNISSPKFLQSRGTDHATNGIRMGIDGWIYIAVGDFGFHNAVDRTGKKLTMLGGGIVRVRPDGTEMEVYTHGMRNIYDVAIDPYMNIFTRGNTNDGGGWNIRFSHQIQSGEYGYPVLFKHFTDEILPALVDVGGGSGTGALFMDDPTWPAKYNQVPMMADWGRNQLYIHRVTADGASFKQQEEEFIKLPQITDLDVDASGRMYMAAWDGAGYSGNPGKGFVVRAVPANWEYKSFPDLKKASVNELADLLKSKSAVARLHAQQELISRPTKKATKAAWKVAADKKLPLYARVAGMYAYAQASGEAGTKNLVKLTQENEMKEYALRALSDRKTRIGNVPVEPFIEAVNSPSERVQAAAIIGLGRLDRAEAIPALLAVDVPATLAAPAKGTEGPHATPNAAVVPAHLAVQALGALNAVDASVNAVGTENSRMALWALRYMHNPKAVDGLIAAYQKTNDEKQKNEILTTLSRLYKKEAPYDGSWWWSTRPDTHGPYYKGIVWEASPAIEKFLKEEQGKADANGKQFFADLNARHRMEIAEFGGDEAVAATEEVDVDLEKIRNQKGQVGKASIEDVMLAMAKIEGDAVKGKALFTQQGCNACHSIEQGEAMKGPFMGQIGSIMNREQIAESILKPNASISQGFASVLITAKGDKTYMGFISQESADQIVMRNIAGQVFTIKTADILTRKELETSMMPAGLANSLSYEEFASLITFLSQQKK
ncbi:heme-binding protein [Pontibacter diazotrophicus]|uniref:Heme-binding protein n=1 Tax=Pontibacter diazotrophicus TaxID=1400979 RepID=A0A3D8LIG5_9BACT|nr:c-type cytochrome [Pontibacter diazotrophicus]RDV17243.1 heme-binding protein [Pontibacter diazotrophicus]